MRYHLEDPEDGPICKKCGKLMTGETCIKGIGVRQFWRCPICRIKIPFQGQDMTN